MPNITTTSTILKCEEILATFGIPDVIVSDHGTQFNSREFKDFLKRNGIQHKQGAPYHPATNGQAERFVQTLKTKLKAAKAVEANVKKALNTILLAYRRSIHPETNKSPAMLMLGIQIQTKLDLMTKSSQKNLPKPEKPKKQFSQEERVAVRDYLSTHKWQFGKVLESSGNLHYQVRLDDNRTWRRHADQMRRVGQDLGNRVEGEQHQQQQRGNEDSYEQQAETSIARSSDPTSSASEVHVSAPSSPEIRRSSRISKQPDIWQYQ
ncbi:PREDICTED: uncharacterized protein K02A2.6-like [Rhagoletis zephyria]|uniref:uncharacterized protein K02A2.6-like n=1 Tax=Rhagoletis zephyria TaxID=28612 RepID=UPI000811239D|nr:PREDICTED: uncharacterized protein K02A2.6-like [Rhagoletis zephyria]